MSTEREPVFGPRLAMLNQVASALGAVWAFFWRWVWRLTVWGIAILIGLWVLAWVIDKAGEPKRLKEQAAAAQADARQARYEASALRDRVDELESRLDEVEARLSY